MPQSQMTGQSMALQRRDTGTKTNKYKDRKNTIKVKQQARDECNSRKDTKTNTKHVYTMGVATKQNELATTESPP